MSRRSTTETGKEIGDEVSGTVLTYLSGGEKKFILYDPEAIVQELLQSKSEVVAPTCSFA